MNKVLELKGNFTHLPKGTAPGLPFLPKKEDSNVTSDKLKNLIKDLELLDKFWRTNNLFDGALIQVNYDRIVAKSNRITSLLANKTNEDMNKKVVGAKYRKEERLKHSIVYYVNKDVIGKTIILLKECSNILDDSYNSIINNEMMKDIQPKDKRLGNISKSSFIKTIVDSYYVESFSVPDSPTSTDLDEMIVTFYDTNENVQDIFRKLNIEFEDFPEKINDNTYLIKKKQYNEIIEKAPYIISMELKNISSFRIAKNESISGISPTIIDPTNEPYIGVIDWPFSKNVYFSKWVDYENWTGLDEEYIIPADRIHGTRVDSIIIDGPNINKDLDDGCGRFRVKHFGIAFGDKIKTKDALLRIREIVTKNPSIKVWNLSLGSDMEINDNYISPIAAELDKLQYEQDAIFIIAGTNDDDSTLNKKIGDPADSINGITVNSVSFEKEKAEFSRKGPVLSFYAKPDISYYGGSKNSFIKAWDEFGYAEVRGTSFAAPWITRKVAYLIYKVGVSKEIAKAMIIDSTLTWDKNDRPSYFYGHGVVPIRIEDVIGAKDDEIKFYISEIATKYDNFAYNVPVPIVGGLCPYVSRATLCYFTKCSRNQGVDYNDIELDLHFGRITKSGIKSINDNKQNDEGLGFVDEETARKNYRKWDNVKVISELFTERKREKKIEGQGLWGLSIKKTGRFSEPNKDKVNYGVVVTLKEMNGANRQREFLRLCNINGWIVNEIDIENRNTIFVNAEEEIEFE